eukprot:337428-Prymnesium_polylepis.3
MACLLLHSCPQCVALPERESNLRVKPRVPLVGTQCQIPTCIHPDIPEPQSRMQRLAPPIVSCWTGLAHASPCVPETTGKGT